jgi:hypothetical protein
MMTFVIGELDRDFADNDAAFPAALAVKGGKSFQGDKARRKTDRALTRGHFP